VPRSLISQSVRGFVVRRVRRSRCRRGRSERSPGWHPSKGRTYRESVSNEIATAWSMVSLRPSSASRAAVAASIADLTISRVRLFIRSIHPLISLVDIELYESGFGAREHSYRGRPLAVQRQGASEPTDVDHAVVPVRDRRTVAMEPLGFRQQWDRTLDLSLDSAWRRLLRTRPPRPPGPRRPSAELRQ